MPVLEAVRSWVVLHASPPAIGAYLLAAVAAFGLGQRTLTSVGPLPLPAPVPAGLLVAALSAVAVATLACHGHRHVVRLAGRPVWWARSLWLVVVLAAGYLPLLACAGRPEQLVRNYLVFTGLALIGGVVGGAVAAALPVALYVVAAAVFGQVETGGRAAFHVWATVLDPQAGGYAPGLAIGLVAAVAFAAAGAYLTGRWQRPD